MLPLAERLHTFSQSLKAVTHKEAIDEPKPLASVIQEIERSFVLMDRNREDIERYLNECKKHLKDGDAENARLLLSRAQGTLMWQAAIHDGLGRDLRPHTSASD
jgi:hypothetical protein